MICDFSHANRGYNCVAGRSNRISLASTSFDRVASLCARAIAHLSIQSNRSALVGLRCRHPYYIVYFLTPKWFSECLNSFRFDLSIMTTWFVTSQLVISSAVSGLMHLRQCVLNTHIHTNYRFWYLSIITIIIRQSCVVALALIGRDSTRSHAFVLYVSMRSHEHRKIHRVICWRNKITFFIAFIVLLRNLTFCVPEMSE